MDFNQVRYFLALANTLNFTRAAEQCYVSQPALTQAIKRLETELGGELIRRDGRYTELTELGNSLRGHFEQIGNWAYFSFGHAYPLADSAEAFPAAACNACHAASAAQDFVFTQYYPVLRAASESEVTGPATMDPAQRETLMTAMTEATAVIGQPRAESGASVGPVPTELGALFEYLGEKKYESFSHRESTVHPSRGPHAVFGAPVRVFLSDDLDASLKAGNASHPAGSSIVKEMYLKDGTTLQGWAVSVKTQDDSDGGNGWFWYEVISTSDPTQLGGGQAGNGVPLCTGCHASGRDFVLSDYPLQ